MELSRTYLEKGGEKRQKEQRDRLFRIILLTKLLMVWGVISYNGRTRLKLSSRTLRANNFISEILGNTPHPAVLHARQRNTARRQDQSGMVPIPEPPRNKVARFFLRLKPPLKTSAR